MFMELSDENFSVIYDEVNTGEVENVCENCIHHIFDDSCCLAHGWGYDDKGNGIAIACYDFKKLLDNNKRVWYIKDINIEGSQ